MAIFDLFRDVKDSAISLLVEKFINNIIKEYGKMVNLKIDSKNKKIELDILLKGEKESIIINIDKYEIVNKNGSNYIKFNKISASREWINVLVDKLIVPNYAPKKMLEINSTYAKVLDMLV